MKFIFTLSLLLLVYVAKAQSPQFAVVRPDGTTYICPTWDSAYRKSVDGDNIFLPAVTITTDLTIDKRLNLYGAGHGPDSTITTGKTSTSSNIFLYSNSSGGRIEGVQTSKDIYFTYSGKQVKNYTISRCKANAIYFSNGFSTPDSLPTNILINECIVLVLDGSNGTNGAQSSGINISKTLIQASARAFVGTVFSNNIFINTQAQYLSSDLINCLFQNNIFLSSQPFATNTGCTNSYYNNININGNPFLYGCPPNTGTEINTISVASVADVFTSYLYPDNYPYKNNYHLKASSLGKNAGTDGTDVGIYGTSQPTSEGWVPGNPHIYFKQVGTNTTSDGKLKVQFKVRTNP